MRTEIGLKVVRGLFILYVFLAVQYGAICSYYLHPNICVYFILIGRKLI